MVPSMSELTETIHNIVAEILEVPPADIKADEKIARYGLDSIRSLSIIGRLRKRYKIKPFQMDLSDTSINDIVQAIKLYLVSKEEVVS